MVVNNYMYAIVLCTVRLRKYLLFLVLYTCNLHEMDLSWGETGGSFLFNKGPTTCFPATLTFMMSLLFI